MAAEKDQSGWLPTPPPPRPARRDAAIETALRRFDGVEDVAPAATEGPRRSWASTHRPQLAMAFSAMLLVVVGVPAALIGLRNAPSTSGHAPSAAVQVRDGAPAAPAKPAAPAPWVAEIAPAAPAGGIPSATRKYRSQDAGVAAANEPTTQAAPIATGAAPPIAAAPPPPAARMAMAAPPPPPAPPPSPPPPPAPAARAERSAEAAADNVVVTGSRIQQPALTAQNGLQAKTAESAGATDPAYRSFLSRLQAAVRSNDSHALIALIGFPLRVNAAGGARVYRDAQSVERDFDEIFTTKVRSAILRQRANRLFVRDQGAMIGSGEIWFDHRCPNATCSPPGPVRITAVNP
ncbi:MAG TPA: hypothetical protein VFK28_06285 [Sphingomicrobium sp.]|nr:hypothetical protein [Sphingomicrobium sp.]